MATETFQGDKGSQDLSDFHCGWWIQYCIEDYVSVPLAGCSGKEFLQISPPFNILWFSQTEDGLQSHVQLRAAYVEIKYLTGILLSLASQPPSLPT